MDPRRFHARLFRRLSRAFLAAVVLPGLASPVASAVLPAGFVETRIATGLSAPTAMEFAPDGRLFVCQQGGRLRVIKNATLLSTDFVTLSVDSSGERGLLGIAFDPAFASNQFVYLYYTVPGGSAHNRVSRFTANGDVAVPGGEVVILELENLSGATNHNGGAIHFGPDGKLYVAVGENANGANSQTLNNRLGKMLRINSDGSIPADNPFYFVAVGVNRSIWALGLRNPFTFGFHPTNGRMFINDVGAGTWEEINDGSAQANYGWNLYEGLGAPPPFINPLYVYPHSGACTAIVGGAFYNSATGHYPADFDGDYFFADLCGGWVRRYDVATGNATDFLTGISTPVDLKIGPQDGDLYYLAIGGGQVFRVSTDLIFRDGF
jgi:glucose/arabinose dehydrogenase